MRGLPDFGAPLDATCFAGFDQPGVVALPDALALATDPAGVPRLVLERFRDAGFGANAQAYGLISAWFVAGWPDRAGEHAVTARAIPDAGVLTVRLDRVDGDPEVIGEPMDWDGSLAAPWGARVSPQAITWMIEALRMRLLSLHAEAVLSVRGVAPRVPVRLEVDAARLLALVPSPDPSGLTALTAELTTSTGALRIADGEAPAERIAAVVLDRLNADLPTPVGSQLWDLAQPFVTRRRVTVSRLLRDLIADAPIDEAVMVPSGVELPALELGWSTLDVLSNLPVQRPGVLACGVNLLAPPRPPARPQAAIAGCELTPEQPRQRLTLRLAPGERLDYLSEAWLVVDGPTGIREVQGRQQGHTSQRLIVAAADFGVRFAHVSADAALLGLATAEVSLRQGSWTGPSVVLDPATPEAALVVTDDSPDGTEPRLSITVRALTGEAAIELPELPAEHLALGLSAVPGWGPHRLTVHNAGTEPQAIELADEAGTSSAMVNLAPAETRAWTWFAADPFRPGFRYRLRPVGEPGAWHGPLTDPALTIPPLTLTTATNGAPR
ncbi:hypothetical protein [Micropruina sp.]|uniref:hypothetical protein n=1 Tax=Micropruina sp. TaxID=2737536 RepID=UPI0039E40DFD